MIQSNPPSSRAERVGGLGLHAMSDDMPDDTQHVPVLLEESVEGLALKVGDTVVDGTLGGGGHARRLAEIVGPTGRVIGLDRDAAALERCRAAGLVGPPFQLEHANFCRLPDLLAQRGLPPVAGVLLDLGLSSDQLADCERGFSFDSDGELDLRFDVGRGEPAWRVLERLDASQLADVIFELGEERHSRRIARRIVERRRTAPIRSAGELAQLVRSCVRSSGRIDPATRTFQALRIYVNDELGSLESILRDLPDCLAPGGRIAIISFHSLEDRRVKQAFRDDERYKALTKKPVRPNQQEQFHNPRSRSAKLRIAQRVEDEALPS